MIGVTKDVRRSREVEVEDERRAIGRKRRGSIEFKERIHGELRGWDMME